MSVKNGGIISSEKKWLTRSKINTMLTYSWSHKGLRLFLLLVTARVMKMFPASSLCHMKNNWFTNGSAKDSAAVKNMHRCQLDHWCIHLDHPRKMLNWKYLHIILIGIKGNVLNNTVYVGLHPWHKTILLFQPQLGWTIMSACGIRMWSPNQME